MKKPRHVVEKNGRYYWTTTPKMRDLGMVGETLPEGKAAAYRRAEELNAQWDEAREKAIEPVRGDFNDLIDQYQRDPVWYGKLAAVTKAEIDYSLAIVAETFGPYRVTGLTRRHCRVFYNRIRVDGSAHKAARVMKWFKRLLNYAVELEIREFNPADKLKMEPLPGRDQLWHPDQIDALIAACIDGGKASSGNVIPPRPSVALAVLIALCTAQREQDVLALTWNQFDGEGVEVTQQKTGKRLWVPLDDDCLAMMPKDRVSTHIVVSEQTGQPYNKDNFARIFRKFCRRAGIPDELQFRDLRRTAATDLGNTGATESEIIAFTGHAPGSSVIRTYVKPGRQAALSGARKRKNERG